MKYEVRRMKKELRRLFCFQIVLIFFRVKTPRILAAALIFALIASAIPAYAENEAITYDELTTNIDLILPPETAIPSLESHSYWQEVERGYNYYGIEATYEGIYDEKPSLSQELPTIFTYIYPYTSEEAVATDFTNWLEDQRFTTGEWILLDTGVNNFSYKTGAGNDSDYFTTYSSESNTLHYVTQEDNLLIVVAFYRDGGEYERENVLAYEEYISDYEETLVVLESVADYIKEALDFFLDDIQPIGPPAEYDYYLTSAEYNLQLDEIYSVPMNGHVSIDIYLDDTSEVGTILDMSGISEASYGAISLGINENAILDFNLYDPFTVSDCEDSAGWHHIYTQDSLDLYKWTNVKIEYGADYGMNIYINNVLQESCNVYKNRADEPVFLGDYPEDIIEESFVGYIKDFKGGYSLDEEGNVTDYLMGGGIFLDVHAGDLNAEAIEYLKDEGIIGGYDDGSFRPDQEVNRAEILKMLLVGFGYEIEVEELEGEFSDVDYESWYAPYVVFAHEWGIIKGYDDGTFKPAQLVNRVEFVKILTKTYGIDLTDYPITSLYSDTDLDAWYSPYVQYAKDNELFEIEDYFYPDQVVTRSEAAEAIYRLLTG